jgi:hypothetical protein
MLPGRRTITLILTAALVVLSVPVLGTGCGADPDEFDTAANYTPEALSQELVLRYRSLNPDAKTSSRRPGKKLSDQTIASRNQADHKARNRSTKKRGSTTIDDVLDDIDYKISLVPKTSRAETTKKMIETIANDSSLADGEKKTLTELVGRAAD